MQCTATNKTPYLHCQPTLLLHVLPFGILLSDFKHVFLRAVNKKQQMMLEINEA